MEDIRTPSISYNSLLKLDVVNYRKVQSVSTTEQFYIESFLFISEFNDHICIDTDIIQKEFRAKCRLDKHRHEQT